MGLPLLLRRRWTWPFTLNPESRLQPHTQPTSIYVAGVHVPVNDSGKRELEVHAVRNEPTELICRTPSVLILGQHVVFEELAQLLHGLALA